MRDKRSMISGNLKKHGKAPFRVALVHGGPGAAGEMAPMAEKLAFGRGVLEPLQTAISLEGQVEELKTILEKEGDLPVTLIGFSWGAWLSYIFAARYPRRVAKLILVGSPPFADRYIAGIQQTRMDRLTPEDREEAEALIAGIAQADDKKKGRLFGRFAELLESADSFAPLKGEKVKLDFRPDIYLKVWPEAAEWRRSGKLLQLGKRIACPVKAIHGDYDPHPAQGVEQPLSGIIVDFHFHLLKNCGHRPWIERYAREEFFRLIEKELP